MSAKALLWLGTVLESHIRLQQEDSLRLPLYFPPALHRPPGPQTPSSQGSGQLPQDQGHFVDDTGTSSETPERLRGMIESPNANMNALEPPPPYLGEGGDDAARRDF
ncbi:hypothetical protein BDV98DRAFT_590058 [Pterulicium gracile]|uniref:Uncharacterized protein n=1 Tax=Pterulicium gracile TaxID=1884261 RepID=A0A5C3QTL6_9AGAR|nr:hypothetical protein BDV98DRAFT_590058 [Pterula gracilis]